MKGIEIRLKNHHFDGSDPIWIIDFLRRFFIDEDAQLMNESQAYFFVFCLTHFISKDAPMMTTKIGIMRSRVCCGVASGKASGSPNFKVRTTP